MRQLIGDFAATLCKLTGERLWRLLHPIIEWGWTPGR